MSPWLTPAPVPVLAFVSAIHAAFLVLRRHRSAGASGRFLLLLPALLFAASPWVFPTLAGVVAGLAAQLAWFVACEKLARPAGPATSPEAGSKEVGGPTPAHRPREFVPVPVLAVHEESDSIRTFRLGRPPDFHFVPGQFLTVRIDIDGQAHARCYSISSAPESTGYLEISVRRQGLVSRAVHAAIRPGSVLFVKPPAGRFTYPADDGRPLVLMAGGVGITPVLSMLRHAVASEPRRPVTLLFSCRSADEVPFAGELALLAARHPQFRVVLTLSGSDLTSGNFSSSSKGRDFGPKRASLTAPRDRPADFLRESAANFSSVRDLTPRVGRIDAALVREVVPSPTGSLFYICGPTPMMDAMRALLLDAGVPSSQIRMEVFQAATAIGARAAAAAGASEFANLVCTVSNVTVPVPAGASLLEAAEAGGVAIPSLCRSGVCGTCRTRLLSGDVRCTSDALDEEDRANHYILPCVAWPSGDCALEA